MRRAIRLHLVAVQGQVLYGGGSLHCSGAWGSRHDMCAVGRRWTQKIRVSPKPLLTPIGEVRRFTWCMANPAGHHPCVVSVDEASVAYMGQWGGAGMLGCKPEESVHVLRNEFKGEALKRQRVSGAARCPDEVQVRGTLRYCAGAAAGTPFTTCRPWWMTARQTTGPGGTRAPTRT